MAEEDNRPTDHGAPISSLPDLATAQEVAAVLRCSPRFVQSEIAAGRLRAVKIAGRYLVPRNAVPPYIEQQTVSPPSAPRSARPVKRGAAIDALADAAAVERCREVAAQLKRSR